MSGFSSVSGGGSPYGELVILNDPGEGQEIVANEANPGTRNVLGLVSTEAGSEARTIAEPVSAGTFLHLYNGNATQDIAITFPYAINAAGNTILTIQTGSGYAVLMSAGNIPNNWTLIEGYNISLF